MPRHGFIAQSIFPDKGFDPCLDLPLTFSGLADSPRNLQHASSQHAPHVFTINLDNPNQTALHPEDFSIQQSLPTRNVMLNSLCSIILLV